MFEASGNHLIHEKGLEDRLEVISAGTKAGPEHDDNWPYHKVEHVRLAALHAGIIKSGEAHVSEERFNKDKTYSDEMVNETRAMLLDYLRPMDRIFRQQAITRAGLQYEGEREQAVSRSDVSLVLGVQRPHAAALKKLFDPQMVYTVNIYAGIPGSIGDMLGVPTAAPYHAAMKRIHSELMPAILRRFAREQGLGDVFAEQLQLI